MSTTKKKYYYDLNLIPFVKNSFKIKVDFLNFTPHSSSSSFSFFQMDRLSLAALFDRNRSMATVLFDIFIACIISIVCASVLSSSESNLFSSLIYFLFSSDIYHDVSMVGFAFVTASAHVSIL